MTNRTTIRIAPVFVVALVLFCDSHGNPSDCDDTQVAALSHINETTDGLAYPKANLIDEMHIPRAIFIRKYSSTDSFQNVNDWYTQRLYGFSGLNFERSLYNAGDINIALNDNHNKHGQKRSVLVRYYCVFHRDEPSNVNVIITRGNDEDCTHVMLIITANSVEPAKKIASKMP